MPNVSVDRKNMAGRIIVHLDRFDSGGATGWAYNEYDLKSSAELILSVDGEFADNIVCDAPRLDVQRSGFESSTVGFSAKIPCKYFDDSIHRIELRAKGKKVLFSPNSSEPSVFLQSVLLSRFEYRGQVDGFKNGSIQGWVFAADRREDTYIVGHEVIIMAYGQRVAQLQSNEFRPDVAQAFNCQPNCGFTFVPPSNLMAGFTVEFSFQVIGSNVELSGSPMRLAFPEMRVYDYLRDLQNEADQLFIKMWQLRTKLREIQQEENYVLGNYNEWALSYYSSLSLLKGTFKHRREPLISIICPCYKPRLSDFQAAVESATGQSYRNFELIIVDDASNDENLDSYLSVISKSDSRIRVFKNKKNEGIGETTNVGIREARGEFIALFDHDDLLVNVALDIMVAAMLATNASLLYSDEDKIDDAGVYSEPNLKPDWNYRLLLSQNYICHLLFFKKTLVLKAGLLNTAFDGSQDHDLILRLAELLSAEEIFHVPEVLYHWRKTPASTSSSGAAKPYTVQAGIRAVQSHLARKKVSAKVSTTIGGTFYKIDMPVTKEPKVTILIPYREQIGLTRTCIDAVLNNTSYRNFEIILIDNWSISDEAARFVEDILTRENATVVRIEEEFNYSRINNIAVREAKGELLLFLNNDVIVSQRDWLTVMVGEILLDSKTAIVGNKLLYPGGLVQHAGVILGVGGVGDHAFRGLDANDPGYVARAICAQNLSAVTAACMLCRADVFHEIGGFDEQNLPVAFNDLDLCLKARAKGYRVTFTPFSSAIHHESISRGSDYKPDRQATFFHENESMNQRWMNVISRDPFYNDHFSRRTGMFQKLAEPRLSPFVVSLINSENP